MVSIRTETETVIKRILPYLRKRGYDVETDIDFETSVKHTQRHATGYVDLLVHCGATRPKFVIEAKKSSRSLTNGDRKQAIEYGQATKVPFVVLTNGTEIETYNTSTGEAIRWNGSLARRIPRKDQLDGALRLLRTKPESTDVPLKGDSESLPFRPSLPLKQLNGLFSRCHNAIRKIEKNEEHAFADLSKILFLKLLEEKQDDDRSFTLPYSYRFHELAARPESEADQIKDAIQRMLAEIRKSGYGDVLVDDLKLRHPKTYHYIVRQLSGVSFSDSGLDTKGAAFEYFVRATLKGKRLGQYFTPRPLVDLMTSLAGLYVPLEALLSGQQVRVVDPACGTGGFLVFHMKELLTELERRLASRSISQATHDAIAERIHHDVFFGSDANEGVAAAAKMNMIIAGDGHTNIRAEDTLKAAATIWQWDNPDIDIVLTNPPFGTSESDSLSATDLSHYAIRTPKGQHLFLQRMLTSLKPGGIVCTVIDDGVLNTATAAPLRRWLLEHADLIAVLSLPEETFQPNKINVKSSVLLMRKLEHPDVDLAREQSIAFLNLHSLGYSGSGEALRGFDFDLLRAEVAGDALSSRESPRTGYHWTAFDVPLAYVRDDKTQRLDLTYWDSELMDSLREIEPVSKLLAEINTIPTRRGRSPSAELYVDADDGFAIVIKAGSCISKFGELIIDGADWIEKAVYDEMPEYAKLREGDVLLASTGDGTLGKACVFDIDVPAVADGHVTIVRPTKDVDPAFLADYLRVGLGAEQVARFATGSTGLIELAKEDAERILVALPGPPSVQRKLVDDLRAAEAKTRHSFDTLNVDLGVARESFRIKSAPPQPSDPG